MHDNPEQQGLPYPHTAISTQPAGCWVQTHRKPLSEGGHSVIISLQKGKQDWKSANVRSNILSEPNLFPSFFIFFKSVIGVIKKR